MSDAVEPHFESTNLPESSKNTTNKISNVCMVEDETTSDRTDLLKDESAALDDRNTEVEVYLKDNSITLEDKAYDYKNESLETEIVILEDMPTENIQEKFEVRITAEEQATSENAAVENVHLELTLPVLQQELSSKSTFGDDDKLEKETVALEDKTTEGDDELKEEITALADVKCDIELEKETIVEDNIATNNNEDKLEDKTVTLENGATNADEEEMGIETFCAEDKATDLGEDKLDNVEVGMVAVDEEQLLAANDRESDDDEKSLDEIDWTNNTRSSKFRENFELPYFQLPKPDLDSFLDETNKNLNCWQDEDAELKRKRVDPVKKFVLNRKILKQIAHEMPLPKRLGEDKGDRQSEEVIEFILDEENPLDRFKRKFVEQSTAVVSHSMPSGRKYPIKNDGLQSLEARRLELKEKLEEQIKERKKEAFLRHREMWEQERKYNESDYEWDENEDDDEEVSEEDDDEPEKEVADAPTVNLFEDDLGANNNEFNEDKESEKMNEPEDTDEEDFVPKKLSERKRKFCVKLESSSESDSEEETERELVNTSPNLFTDISKEKADYASDCNQNESDAVHERLSSPERHQASKVIPDSEGDDSLPDSFKSKDSYKTELNVSCSVMSGKTNEMSQERSGELQYTTQEIMNMMSDASDGEHDQSIAEDLLNCPIKKGLNIEEFFEDEAELSGDDVGSDEADDELDDEDHHELEVIEEDLPSSEVLRDQINDLHMKQLLNDDEQMLNNLKEQFLEGGEMYSEGGGRSRKFAWKSSADLDGNPGGYSSSESETEAAPDEAWNAINEEKIKWRQENETDDLNDSSYSSPHTSKLKIITKNTSLVGDEVLLTQKRNSIKRPRASLLNDGEGMTSILKKLKASEGQSGSRATKHFVFRNEENGSSTSKERASVGSSGKENITTPKRCLTDSIFGKL